MLFSLTRLTTLTALVGLCLPGLALAQLGFGGRAVQDGDLVVTISGDEEVFINIDNCAERLDTSYTVRGSLTNGASLGRGDMRLYFARGGTTCDRDTVDGCPEISADRTCECIKETDTESSLQEQITLFDRWPEACDESADTEVTFTLDFQEEGINDQNDNTAKSEEPAKIIVDLISPPAPTVQPELDPVDGAIEVTFEDENRADVDRYEVCYRVAVAQGNNDAGVGDSGPSTGNGSDLPLPFDLGVAGGATTGGGGQPTNATRRGDFRCNCDRKSTTRFRCEGLVNYETYEVVVATLDEAGNRSANGPSATARPEGIDDFGERYAKRGGAERGGCQMARGSDLAGLLCLLLGGIVWASVRRRRHG